VTTEASTDAKLTTDAKLRQIIAEQEEIFVRRQPKSQRLAEQAENGTHFAQPTPDAIAVAHELARRFGLPSWRFANSGTEATMDAVHLMRSITGRDLIIKIEGCYHGHHDSVQVSVAPGEEDAGPRENPSSAPSSSGIRRPSPT
jgi:glutamate-1-semialdehyde 2,1-aminomutase